ncbi:hypothetical protein cyc_04683 [Cyclospora cayetanensis]|uniref:Uncharacterized protein n=1 Tax=Cyclospora cayetanensis TaxID=88456 RepID=A0A1D3CRI5_9EIME|nr:hypothetical protein cyc_04683 [Cyclospora cayetanensis]
MPSAALGVAGKFSLSVLPATKNSEKLEVHCTCHQACGTHLAMRERHLLHSSASCHADQHRQNLQLQEGTRKHTARDIHLMSFAAAAPTDGRGNSGRRGNRMGTVEKGRGGIPREPRGMAYTPFPSPQVFERRRKLRSARDKDYAMQGSKKPAH